MIEVAIEAFTAVLPKENTETTTNEDDETE